MKRGRTDDQGDPPLRSHAKLPTVRTMRAPLVEVVQLPHGPTRVLWRRSARAKRISLRIDQREGGVIVTLPARAAQATGRALLQQHAGWVADRLTRLPATLAFVDNSEVFLNGDLVRVRHRPGRGVTRLEAGELVVTGAPEFLPRRIGDFMRTEARWRLGAAAAKKAVQAGLRVRRVIVKDTRTRWGSCTATGTLMFSWRLVMAPPLVQDYVVAHEVAHLRHMNHGPQFWALVADLTPHREAATHWLSTGSAQLIRAG